MARSKARAPARITAVEAASVFQPPFVYGEQPEGELLDVDDTSCRDRLITGGQNLSPVIGV